MFFYFFQNHPVDNFPSKRHEVNVYGVFILEINLLTHTQRQV